MSIYITSDHGGFELKNKLFGYLKQKGFDVMDMGPEQYIENDDYPDYVAPAMKKVQENSENKAILICRNGVGVCIAANKFKGIRAGLSWNTKHVQSARTDDDINTLCLGADYLNFGKAKKIAETWLNTKFSGDERHVRRLRKVYDNSGNI